MNDQPSLNGEVNHLHKTLYILDKQAVTFFTIILLNSILKKFNSKMEPQYSLLSF